MMAIPQNGRVVIIDDNWEEAKPIVKVLGRKAIPVLYYSGIEDCPSDPLDDVRIVFLDLRLLPGNSAALESIRAAYSVFDRLISEKNGPCFLILWSKHPEDCELFLELINKYKPSIMPSWHTLINKNDFIKPEKGSGWVEKSGASDRLQTLLEQAVSSHKALQAVILWEASMHKSASGVVKELYSLAQKETDADQQLTALIASIGEAGMGKKFFKAPADQQITEVFSVLTEMSMDIMEAYSASSGHTLTMPSVIGPDAAAASAVNSRLCFANSCGAKNGPGQLYFTNKKKIIEEYFGAKFEAWWDEMLCVTAPQSVDEADKKKWQREKMKELRANSILVLAEISPSCDFAQNKRKLLRIVPGLWVKTEDYAFILGQTQYLSKTPTIKGTVSGAGQDVGCLVFNLRYASTFVEVNWNKIVEEHSLDISKKMRRSLVVDIQTRLAAHVSRPGIRSLNIL